MLTYLDREEYLSTINHPVYFFFCMTSSPDHAPTLETLQTDFLADPSDPVRCIALAKALRDGGDLDEAENIITIGLSLLPPHTEIDQNEPAIMKKTMYLELAHVFLEKGKKAYEQRNLPKAIEWLEKAKKNGEHPSAAALLAVIYTQLATHNTALAEGHIREIPQQY
jgi:tetratricopeptide (TPR) repeat protein